MTNATPCPGCQHEPHAPGVECETPVNHGPSRFHLCLCLNQPGADRACPPLMDCQGGTLGYSDVWHLQRGQSLQGANGEIVTPDVLTAVPAVVEPPADRAAVYADTARTATETAARLRAEGRHERAQGADDVADLLRAGERLESQEQPADRAALRDRIAQALIAWTHRDADPKYAALRRDETVRANAYSRADAVLAVLPAPVDQAAALTDSERQFLTFALDLAQEQMFSRGDEFTDEDEAALKRLRRMADETQSAECSCGVLRTGPGRHLPECPNRPATGPRQDETHDPVGVYAAVNAGIPPRCSCGKPVWCATANDNLVPHGEPIDIGWINGTLEARLQLSVRPGMDPIERDQLLDDLRDTIARLVPVRPTPGRKP